MQRGVGQRNIHLKCMPYRDGIVILFTQATENVGVLVPATMFQPAEVTSTSEDGV
jgi:hypothetical protein